MTRWIVGIAAALLFLLLVVVAGAAAFYFLYWKPRQDAGPLSAEALHLSADVGVVGGADITKILATPLFALVKGQQSVTSGLQEAKDQIGLDLEKDLHEVAFGIWVSPGKDNEGVALLTGTFSSGRLRQYLEKEGKAGSDRAGVQVYEVDSGTSLALVSDTLVAVGTTDRLGTYLENRQAGRRPLGEHAILMGHLRTIPKETVLFVQVAEPALGQLRDVAGEGAPMGFEPPPLKSLTVTADVSPGLILRITARPRREQDAESFGRQLEAVVTMGSAFAGDSPDIERILGGVKVSRGPGEVAVTLEAPWDVLGRAFVTPLLGARISANESTAVGNIRTMISAQVTFQSVSGMRFTTTDCLKAPDSCLADYSGPAFLPEGFSCPGEMSGYRYDLVLNAEADAFALTAVPSKAGETGKRSFCGDGQGYVCQFDDGRTPYASGGVCPADCEPVG